MRGNKLLKTKQRRKTLNHAAYYAKLKYDIAVLNRSLGAMYLCVCLYASVRPMLSLSQLNIIGIYA